VYKRQVQVIDSLYRGGAQQLLVTFAIEAQRRGIKTSVVCLKDEDRGSNLVERLNGLGVEVLRLAAPKMLAPKRIWQLTRWLRRNQVSVVHTHLTYGNVVGILAARLANIPVVATMHLAGFDPSIANRQQQFEAQVVQRLAQQIIAVGYTTRDAYQPIMPNRQLHVVHNAVVAVPEISPEQRQILAKLNLPIREDRLVGIEQANGQLTHLIFDQGEPLARSGLLIGVPQRQRSQLPAQLGCEVSDNPHMPGLIKVQMLGQTSVPGVYAAGDATAGMQQAINAAAGGAMAGAGINHELIQDMLKQL